MKEALKKKEKLAKSQKISLKRTLKMVMPYWTSEESVFALSFLALTIFLNGMFIYMNFVANFWYKRLYDALQSSNYDSFKLEVYNFFWIAAFFIFFFVTKSFASSFLGFRWRKWLTNSYLKKWLDEKNYYRMMLLDKPVDNPDQRIQQDMNLFASYTLSLTLEVLSNIGNVIVFAGILWTAIDAIEFTLLNHNFKIDGYLFYVALVYCIFTTGMIIVIGRPLVKLGFLQERYEANFRYNLVRVRERREEIATYDGVDYELTNLDGKFKDIITNFYQILVRRMYVNMWQNFTLNASNILPFVVVAPKLFSGAVTLGVLMQVVNAFGQVQESFNVLVLKFTDFATWKASANRLGEFFEVMDNLEHDRFHKNNGNIAIRDRIKGLKIENVSLYTPQQNQILKNISLEVKDGEKIVITGESGIGKSTLIRTMSGIWPYAKGKIDLPSGKNIMFVPQKPYMPIGTLRQCLIYPLEVSNITISDDEIKKLLKDFRLEKLVDLLDVNEDWGVTLSVGEQQRIAFIRILVRKPDWLIMDEPTASLGEADEEYFFEQLMKKLKNISIITVSHSASIIKYHDKKIDATIWKKQLA